jgi:hypothetical protein
LLATQALLHQAQLSGAPLLTEHHKRFMQALATSFMQFQQQRQQQAQLF